MEIYEYIDSKTATYLRPTGRMAQRTFYLLPKIHKEKSKWTKPNLPPGRPIVSNVGTEFSNVSRWLDHFLQPVVNELYKKNLVKDTYHFLETLESLALSKEGDYLLFTADVSDLYTNIPLTGAREKIQKRLDSVPDCTRPPTACLLRLLDLILNKNDMEFNGQHFLQVKGVSMGNNCAPSIANLYLADMDEYIQAEVAPVLYRRFIDDIFGIWDLAKGEFGPQAEKINQFDPNLKLTFETSKLSAVFLDLKVLITERLKREGKLDYCVFFKPTDSHQLLHRNSCHPKHTFKGVVKSQILRYRRLSSREQDFDNSCEILQKALRTRGYSNSDLCEWKNEIVKKHPYPTPKSKIAGAKKEPVLPFMVKYHPHLSFVPRFMRQRWQNIRNDFPEVNDILPTNITVAWRKNSNLRNKLVRAKITPQT